MIDEKDGGIKNLILMKSNSLWEVEVVNRLESGVPSSQATEKSKKMNEVSNFEVVELSFCPI